MLYRTGERWSRANLGGVLAVRRRIAAVWFCLHCWPSKSTSRLFFFNLLPIPPLDGSRVVRNMLPYSAVQVYDRIGGWLSYLLMIFVGGFLLNLLLWPAPGILVFSPLLSDCENPVHFAAPPPATME